LIRDLTGINPARDGSLSQDALLGVNVRFSKQYRYQAYSRYRVMMNKYELISLVLVLFGKKQRCRLWKYTLT
jgi:hypothetical protein